MKKCILALISIITSLLLTISFAPIASAQTTSEGEQIAALVAQISDLLAIINSLQAQLNQVETQTQELLDFVYSRNLTIGSRGEDVKQLQVTLNKDPRTRIAVSGPGSPGSESDYFGNLTKDAVIKFQELYKDEILIPNGLSFGSGFVGPSTIAKLNTLGEKIDAVAIDFQEDEKFDELLEEIEEEIVEIEEEEKDDDNKDEDEVDEAEDEKEEVDPAKLPDFNFKAIEYSVPSGQNTKLYWNTIGIVSKCTASGAWSGSKVTGEGSEYTENLADQKQYTLECANEHGTTSKSITISITSATTKPSLTFESNFKSIVYKGDIELEWEVRGADSCEASGDWSGSKSIKGGTQELEDLPSDKTYTLSCTNGLGTTQKTISIDVGTPATPVVTLTTTDSVDRNGKASVTWTVSNDADNCIASGGWSGSVDPESGSYTSNPLTSDTTFELFCTNLGGSHTQSVTTEVLKDAPTITLSATPNGIAVDSVSVIQWSVTDATSCTASGAWSGSKALSGSESTGPLQASTTYTLECSNEDKSTTKSITVNVS